MLSFLKPFLPLDSPRVFNKCMEDRIFDEFFMEKLIYIYRSYDLDMFQLSGNERIKQIVFAWNGIFNTITRYNELPEHVEQLVINLVHFSMNLWFSLEWQYCDSSKRADLLMYIIRLRRVFKKIPHLKQLNWQYLMSLNLTPWKDTYFKKYLPKEQNEDEALSTLRSEEYLGEVADPEDIAILKQEGLLITLLRLIKLFDAGCIDAVKHFSIRMITTWNQLQLQNGFNDVLPEVKRCLNMISHIHMMAVYEKDNSSGFEIDNMINDIRVYHKIIVDAQRCGRIFDDDFHKDLTTPAALIAITSVKMKQTFQELAESVIIDLSGKSSSTLFGAVYHGYITYLLANILVNLNKQKVEDFSANIVTYKRLLHIYVIEREQSERFALSEGRKKKLQKTSHNITYTVFELYNHRNNIGKGNRCSNLINQKSNTMQIQRECAELFDLENEKRYDPVFQTMPNDESLTKEFYEILSKSNYKGWHYARLILLLKIMVREINEINKWCYHPGLKTEFILNLESALAKRFEDLAHIFEDHIFMEQEFWLTAFYLHPIQNYFDKVVFCGQRFLRTVNYLNRGCMNEIILKPSDKTSAVNSNIIPVDGDEGTSCAFMNAKYGLLSSTFDVKEIAKMTRPDTALNDYSSLAKALRKLRLPENIIKDLLTVTFSLRHANFTWAADWTKLRKRCKSLLMSPELKRTLVESNMAEANDRLKYLKIDYQKYKNLPQLDYGTIEEGYEDDYTGDDQNDDDDSDENDVYDQDPKNAARKVKQKQEDSEYERSESPAEVLEQPPELNDDNPSGKRSSARRAAAVIASAMLREDYHLKLNKKKEEMKSKSNDFIDKPNNFPLLNNENENQVNESVNIINSLPSTSSNVKNSIEISNDKLTKLYTNSTPGFIPVPNCSENEENQENVYVDSELLMLQKVKLILDKLKIKRELEHSAKANQTTIDTSDDDDHDHDDGDDHDHDYDVHIKKNDMFNATGNESNEDSINTKKQACKLNDKKRIAEESNVNDENTAATINSISVVQNEIEQLMTTPQKKAKIEILDTQIFHLQPQILTQNYQEPLEIEMQQSKTDEIKPDKNELKPPTEFENENNKSAAYENIIEQTTISDDNKHENVNDNNIKIEIECKQEFISLNQSLAATIETLQNQSIQSISSEQEANNEVSVSMFQEKNNLNLMQNTKETINKETNNFNDDIEAAISVMVPTGKLMKLADETKIIDALETPTTTSTKATEEILFKKSENIAQPIILTNQNQTSFDDFDYDDIINSSVVVIDTKKLASFNKQKQYPFKNILCSTLRENDNDKIEKNTNFESDKQQLKSIEETTSSNTIMENYEHKINSNKLSIEIAKTTNSKNKIPIEKIKLEIEEFDATKATNFTEISTNNKITEKFKQLNEKSKYKKTYEIPITTSTTTTTNTKNCEKLSGKPKSFSNIFASSQLLSDESSTTIKTPTTTTQSSSIIDNIKAHSIISIKSEFKTNKTTTNTNDLINLCLQNKCFVKIKRLCINMSGQNKQPTVRLRRFNMQKYLASTVRKKSRSRSKSKPKYFESGESSSSPAPYKRRSRKRVRSITKEEDDDNLSLSSDEDYKPLKSIKRSTSTTSSSSNSLPSASIAALNRSIQQKQTEKNRIKNFSVVPRSGSGLKVCISSLRNEPPIECIELSSENDEDNPLQFDTFNIVVADENDPLFEVETDIMEMREYK